MADTTQDNGKRPPMSTRLEDALENADRGHRPSEWEDVAQELADAIRAEQPTAVLAEVWLERGRQDAKWGQQNHPSGTRDDARMLGDVSLPTWGTVCYRARNLTDLRAKTGRVTFLDILLEEVAEAFSEDDDRRVRAELVQVAAVAVEWIEAIDRRTQDNGKRHQ